MKPLSSGLRLRRPEPRRSRPELRRSRHTLRRSGHTLRPNAQEPTPPKPKSLVYMLNWPGCEGITPDRASALGAAELLAHLCGSIEAFDRQREDGGRL